MGTNGSMQNDTLAKINRNPQHKQVQLRPKTGHTNRGTNLKIEVDLLSVTQSHNTNRKS